VQSTPGVWHDLEHRLRQTPVAVLDVDAAGVEYCDEAGFALLHYLGMGGMSAPSGKVTVRGLRPEYAKRFETFTAEDYQKNRPQPPEESHPVEEVGQAATSVARDFQEEIAFLGEVSLAMAGNLTRPKRMRWSEVARVFEVAGVNALPIVSLISFLVGVIIAFESAAPFAVFGAKIFIANMIGLIMARELGPIMTGIILAGRSGSAFAAELGTMKVNEELNALETMGLSPMRFLVVQRILAGMLLTPLLTIFAMFVGIGGGVVVMLSMGFSLEAIYNQMTSSLRYKDLLVGTLKGVVFGVLIAGVGCLRGLQTKQGPSAVGESTTRAVVSGILLVIVADAMFSVILYALNL
jgi:phospholipid/cholesterol/gamma-HCH transport system permease protein